MLYAGVGFLHEELKIFSEINPALTWTFVGGLELHWVTGFLTLQLKLSLEGLLPRSPLENVEMPSVCVMLVVL